MQRSPLTAWLRPALALLAVAGVLTLSACGGGGGSVNGPQDNTPPPSVVSIFPPSQTIYPQTTANLTISGGVEPYRVFSSNSAVLPLATNVTNNSVLLFANAVSSTTSVTVTVQDAIGQTATSTVLVAPALLFPNGLTISASDTSCGAASLCTGGTGTVRVQATGIAGTALAGRQIKFDVVYGAFGILSQNPATPLVQSIVVGTDTAGVATVGIQALVDVNTQPAQIRATDVSSGQALIGNFTIVRNQNGAAFITVVPNTATITGRDTVTCSSGVAVDYRIYGGTPPYRVTSSFPQTITIINPVVNESGGYFEAITNGSCVDPIVFSILDSAGRQTTATLSNKPGTADPPPVAPSLVVTPTTFGNLTTSCVGNTYTIAVSGGNVPYNITILSRPVGSLYPTFQSTLATSGTVDFSGLGFDATHLTSTGSYKFRVTSVDQQLQDVVVSCGVN